MRKKKTKFETINNSTVSSTWAVLINSVVTHDGVKLGSVIAHVLDTLPLGVDLVVGFDLLKRANFQFVFENGTHLIKFASTEKSICSADNNFAKHISTNASNQKPKNTGEVSRIVIDDKDFSATFNGKHWSISWKWRGTGKI